MGVVLYEGPSRIEPQTEIVVVLTGLNSKSRNTKTGPMAQTWILNKNIPPIDALRTGADSAVCGKCPLRGIGGCYVNVGQAPYQVFRTYKKGSYTHKLRLGTVPPEMGIRIGTYGDPTAVPIEVWRPLYSNIFNFWTGYTHHWDDPNNQDYKNFCMASVETEEQMLVAKSLGWRTFRTLPVGAEWHRQEEICPATVNNKVTCAKCRICNGVRAPSDTRRDVVIVAHGAKAKNVHNK